jgi:hypothetical protein
MSPADWAVRSGLQGTTLTNLPNQATLDETAAEKFAFFRMERLGSPSGESPGPANPQRLEIDTWFNEYFNRGFPAAAVTRVVHVAGRAAIRLETAEVGGRYAHIYIPADQDVIEVSFALFSPFTSTYESMLATLTF